MGQESGKGIFEELGVGATARVRHDLRSPLAAIQAYADLLVDEVSGPLNAEQADYARTILENVERMEELIERLRIEEPKDH